MVQQLKKTLCCLLTYVNLSLPYNPQFHFLVYTPKNGNKNLKEVSALTRSLPPYSQQVRYGNTETSIDRWTDKEKVVDMHSGIVFNLEKGHFDTFSIINEPEDILIFINQSQKEKFC